MSLYVESTEHSMLTNKIETNSDAEDMLIAVRGEGAGGWVKKGAGINLKKQPPHRHRQQCGDYQREGGTGR